VPRPRRGSRRSLLPGTQKSKTLSFKREKDEDKKPNPDDVLRWLKDFVTSLSEGAAGAMWRWARAWPVDLVLLRLRAG
jgi:hypothetical protein